jgi:hypothetical protein
MGWLNIQILTFFKIHVVTSEVSYKFDLLGKKVIAFCEPTEYGKTHIQSGQSVAMFKMYH